ncbi:MAG: zinc ribbon domain-containing protein [Leptolinea sp.]|jgi:RNA polymerase subunit RPABC4/transcription elongation factor Spt4/cell division protein FtsX|nr:zinc ribbon domain-containing protein [Leptolinea sp.]
MPFDPSSFSGIFQYLVGFGAAFFAALWLSLIIWTFRDIRARTRDSFARILAVLVVAVLNVLGIVIYLILRPGRTLEEEYQRTLEEEALLKAIEEINTCPGCGRHTREDWVICPTCQTRLKKSCPACHKLLELPWSICPYCGAAAGETPSASTSNSDQLLQV